VGVVLKMPGHPSQYLRWGHPSGNNTTYDKVWAVLFKLWNDTSLPLLFHNAKFDLSVARYHFDLEVPHWSRIHDTMFLGYLDDPHSRRMGLKELCEDLFNWPADERDAVGEWLWENRHTVYAATGDRLQRRNGGVGNAGKYFWLVPGHVLEPYAVGDTDRTEALFSHLHPKVLSEGMGPSYDRERQLLPILMENERDGITLDTEALSIDIERYEAAFDMAEAWLRQHLKSPGLNLDADADVGAALVHAGALQGNLTIGKNGNLSVSKVNLLPDNFKDVRLFQALGYRNRLKTCMEMFMKPWLAQARRRPDGRISTNWSQTRGGDGGTRTGRPSTTTPNFLNISKDFEGRPDGYTHPAWLGVPVLPLVRRYILADAGHVFLHRDFDGQELRVFGHFESGKLHAAYIADPGLDVHTLVMGEIERLSPTTKLDRTKVKIINFRTIYGSGVPGLSEALGCDLATAKEFKAVHAKALPGMKILNDEIKRLVGRGTAIVTLGGRRYHPEPPKVDEETGETRDYVYKLLNYLIQGSAADLTKQAIIDWYYDPRRDPRTRFLVTVYDEINISAPLDCAAAQMLLLKEIMERDRLTVPMVSAGKWGWSWGGAVKPGKGEIEAEALTKWLEKTQ
jgi:DNA polymerase I-like protein with 3'-5' exonuclease and polymerase domains